MQGILEEWKVRLDTDRPTTISPTSTPTTQMLRNLYIHSDRPFDLLQQFCHRVSHALRAGINPPAHASYVNPTPRCEKYPYPAIAISDLSTLTPPWKSMKEGAEPTNLGILLHALGKLPLMKFAELLKMGRYWSAGGNGLVGLI